MDVETQDFSLAVEYLAHLRSPMDVIGIVAIKADELLDYAAQLRKTPQNVYWVRFMVTEIIGNNTFFAIQFDIFGRRFEDGRVRSSTYVLFFGNVSPIPKNPEFQAATLLWTVPAFLCYYIGAMFPETRGKKNTKITLMKAILGCRTNPHFEYALVNMQVTIENAFQRTLAEVGTEARRVMGTYVYGHISFAFPDVPVLPNTSSVSGLTPLWQPRDELVSPGPMNSLARRLDAILGCKHEKRKRVI